MSEFAKRLKYQRQRRGLNQQQIAKAMGVSQVSVSNWERGVKEPNFSRLVKLSKLFGQTTDYMLGVSDEDSSHALYC